MEEKQRFIVTRDGSHTLYSEQFHATYHSVNGAREESLYVFIKNGLLKYLSEHNTNELNILEMGFGSGLNAILTYIEAQKLRLKINYHTIEAFPVNLNDVNQLNYSSNFSETDLATFKKLHECSWNSSHEINNTFTLTKHNCTLQNFSTNKQFDIIYFDAFSPTQQPELWTEEVFTKMYNNLNNKGILVTYCAQGQMKRNLKVAGFMVKALPGFFGKREMTLAIKQ